MATPPRTLTLSVLEGRYAIVKFPHGTAIPAWATSGAFFSVTRTAEELSVVASEDAVPADLDASRGWRLMKLHGPFAFDEAGIVAAVTSPLARVGLGVFVISTYDTDYLLVQQEEAPAAVEALEHAGHRILQLELLNSESS
jgi:uncharacterized protein